MEKWRDGDWDGAVAEWITPAARGDADALFNMGQAYRLGRGVPQSRSSAIEYYRRAADKGHVEATANLGITLWQEGRKTEALVHLRKAADRGDLRASYVLGVATFGGDVAPRNPALGYAYILRSRDGGLSLAENQAMRMAALMTPDDKARGEAAARALAAGEPVAVAMASAVAKPIPESGANQAETAESEDEAETRPEPPAKVREAAVKATRPEKARPAEQLGAWLVQLGAYTSEPAARTAWATLVSQSATLLRGESPIYSPKGNLVRLQVGGFADRADASKLCANLAAAGRPCFVTRN